MIFCSVDYLSIGIWSSKHEVSGFRNQTQGFRILESYEKVCHLPSLSQCDCWVIKSSNFSWWHSFVADALSMRGIRAVDGRCEPVVAQPIKSTRYNEKTTYAGWSEFELLPTGSLTLPYPEYPVCAPLMIMTSPFGISIISGIILGSSILSISQPFLIPSGVRVIRMHWSEAGSWDESCSTGIWSLVVVPPQMRTSGI